MKKVIVFIILIILPLRVSGNSIILPPSIDYFRSTAGERLFFYYQELHKGSFYIDNDFRLYNSNKYRDKFGNEFNFKYTRFINIISIKYCPISKTQFSIRVPYVYLNKNRSTNYGLSDVFLGVSYEIVQFLNNKIYLSSGVKIPVGYHNKYDYEKLPLGTGSFDIPFIINSDFNIKNDLIFFDVGYILNGKSDVSNYPLTMNLKRNNGDEIFSDIVIVKEYNALGVKFEMNYYYVFDSSISGRPRRNDSHSKFSITPGLIFSPKFKNIKLELGLSYDLICKNNYSGYSPVVRIHYNKQRKVL